MKPRLALYQPDIAGNTGAILRLAACLDLGVDVIGPAGFRLDDKSLKRAGMDYIERARLTRHVDWPAFEAWRKSQDRRLVLFTTGGATDYLDFTFRADDVLLFGRESAGVPEAVHQSADARLVIPMSRDARSFECRACRSDGSGRGIAAIALTGRFDTWPDERSIGRHMSDCPLQCDFRRFGIIVLFAV